MYIFTEGEVTEPSYIDIICEHGTPGAAGHRVERHLCNVTAKSSLRKPLPMVEAAVVRQHDAERDARSAGLTDDDWNWPQTWVLFDRDQHPDIQKAFARAREGGVRIAYSHPCFELWRLLHYQNYTSTFGGVCDEPAGRLRRQAGFCSTYGAAVSSVSDTLAKQVMPGQVLYRYGDAKKAAVRVNAGHEGRPDPTTWDPYTDVWEFVESALLIADY